MGSINEFNIKTLKGKVISFSDFRGKVLLIVNVASKCGLTPQYKGLQNLYKKYKSQGLEVLGFPCNDFAEQEPGTKAEIISFCEGFKITFPIFQKITVLNEPVHPLYKLLLKGMQQHFYLCLFLFLIHLYLIDLKD